MGASREREMQKVSRSCRMRKSNLSSGLRNVLPMHLAKCPKVEVEEVELLLQLRTKALQQMEFVVKSN